MEIKVEHQGNSWVVLYKNERQEFDTWVEAVKYADALRERELDEKRKNAPGNGDCPRERSRRSS